MMAGGGTSQLSTQEQKHLGCCQPSSPTPYKTQPPHVFIRGHHQLTRHAFPQARSDLRILNATFLTQHSQYPLPIGWFRTRVRIPLPCSLRIHIYMFAFSIFQFSLLCALSTRHSPPGFLPMGIVFLQGSKA